MNALPCFSSPPPLFSFFFADRSYGRQNRTPPIFPTRSSTRKTFSSLTDTAEIQEKLEAFRSWALEKGILDKKNSVVVPKLCGSPPPHPQRLGLFAHRRDVSEGEEALSIPQELWISVSASHSSPEIGSFCRNCRPWVALALFLLFEKNKKSSSVWHAYIDILPPVLDSPLFWSEEELTELEGTQLIGSILGYRQHVESEYEKVREEMILPNPAVFDQSVFTLEAFLWAFGILRSRTFPPLTGDDLALVPLADLVNHGMVINMEAPSWERKSSGFFPRREYLSLRAPIATKEGEQLVMQYGKNKSNGQLALDYGFVEPGSMRSAVRDSFMLTLEIPESDRFYGDKLDIAELNGLDATIYFDLIYGEGLPDNMLPYLRLIALNGPDAFLLEALFRNSVWDHLQLPVSQENEETVCNMILEGCKSALSGYPTSIDEDLSLLESNELSTRATMAIYIRLGEKRALGELQLIFENQKSKLTELEYYATRRLRTLGLLDDKGDMTPWVFEG